eukprot:TRINITY_DN14206_c0_g1_i3.p1 TRINITY_DN14206_c0_g1~~TRINITY_DN14206_c0_g1_i3.p1  ORF type:complete len:217 (-),score=19.47 TRINITY_DN14206_c0_g1_i3:261-911(-)
MGISEDERLLLTNKAERSLRASWKIVPQKIDVTPQCSTGQETLKNIQSIQSTIISRYLVVGVMLQTIFRRQLTRSCYHLVSGVGAVQQCEVASGPWQLNVQVGGVDKLGEADKRFRRWQHCSCPPMTDGETPKLVIEYDPEDVDKFISFADAMEAEFPHIIIEGNVEGVEPRSGSFEITTMDGQQLFSKLVSQRYPENVEIFKVVESLGMSNQQSS